MCLCMYIYIYFYSYFFVTYIFCLYCAALWERLKCCARMKVNGTCNLTIGSADLVVKYSIWLHKKHYAFFVWWSLLLLNASFWIFQIFFHFWFTYCLIYRGLLSALFFFFYVLLFMIVHALRICYCCVCVCVAYLGKLCCVLWTVLYRLVFCLFVVVLFFVFSFLLLS